MNRRRIQIVAGVAVLLLAAGLGSLFTWLGTSGDGERRPAALSAIDEAVQSSGVIQACVDERGAVRIVDEEKACQLAGEIVERAIRFQRAGATTLWISPLFGGGNIGGHNNLRISTGGNSGLVRTTRNFPLALPSDRKIARVTVCYQTTNSRTYIEKVELERVTTPFSLTIVHHDGTHLTSTTPVCADSVPSSPVPIDSAMMLMLGVYFGAPADLVDVGAIGLELVP